MAVPMERWSIERPFDSAEWLTWRSDGLPREWGSPRADDDELSEPGSDPPPTTRTDEPDESSSR
jgi:hypothetical protein